jgi:hypothetical protein
MTLWRDLFTRILLLLIDIRLLAVSIAPLFRYVDEAFRAYTNISQCH